MSVTVRQIGAVMPQLKIDLEGFQKALDENDAAASRLRETLRTSVQPELTNVSHLVTRQQETKRTISALLTRSEDALQAFSKDCNDLHSQVEQLPRLYERINAAGQGNASCALGMIYLPSPFFERLLSDLNSRSTTIQEQIRTVEKTIQAYQQADPNEPTQANVNMVEQVVRMQYTQFRALANRLALIQERCQIARDAAIRTKGVGAGMFARGYATRRDGTLGLGPASSTGAYGQPGYGQQPSLIGGFMPAGGTMGTDSFVFSVSFCFLRFEFSAREFDVSARLAYI